MRVAMVVYSFYETDTRVIRYAESLVSNGTEVDVIALRGERQERTDVINGVNLFRIQERTFGEKGALSYGCALLKFLLRASACLTRQHIKHPYKLIHVNNVPDFLVFSAILPKLAGARVIHDIHDIVPEFFAFKFKADPTGSLFKLMVLVEKLSLSFADHVIVSNHIWQERVNQRSARKCKTTVIINYPDYARFGRKGPRQEGNGGLTMLYPGTLNYQQGVDVAIKAFALVKDEIPGAEFVIYGDGSERRSLEDLVAQLGLTGRVVFKGLVSSEEIAAAMENADLGIEPKRDGLFAGEALSMKIFEFMAAEVPVIASNTKVHRYYFNDSVVRFFSAGDEKDLAQKMLELGRSESLRRAICGNASQFVENYYWDRRQDEYTRLVEDMTARRAGAAGG
jgi:glycosyltransferase involved in cell wall biosynthesis